jgi:hypothetical protein
VLGARVDLGYVDLEFDLALKENGSGRRAFVLDPERHRAGHAVCELGDLRGEMECGTDESIQPLSIQHYTDERILCTV